MKQLRKYLISAEIFGWMRGDWNVVGETRLYTLREAKARARKYMIGGSLPGSKKVWVLEIKEELVESDQYKTVVRP